MPLPKTEVYTVLSDVCSRLMVFTMFTMFLIHWRSPKFRISGCPGILEYQLQILPCTCNSDITAPVNSIAGLRMIALCGWLDSFILCWEASGRTGNSVAAPKILMAVMPNLANKAWSISF
jgi:hypothetical protein